MDITKFYRTCPKCEGRGYVPKSAYDPVHKTSSAYSEPCQYCNGKGFLDDNTRLIDDTKAVSAAWCMWGAIQEANALGKCNIGLYNIAKQAMEYADLI